MLQDASLREQMTNQEQSGERCPSCDSDRREIKVRRCILMPHPWHSTVQPSAPPRCTCEQLKAAGHHYSTGCPVHGEGPWKPSAPPQPTVGMPKFSKQLDNLREKLQREPVVSVPQPPAQPELEIAEANLAEYAKRYFEAYDTYFRAWLREIGGVIVPKTHQIDGFVLRTRGIYEKAQLVDRIKKILCDQLKEKADAQQMFDAVFKFLAENRHDKVPTN